MRRLQLRSIETVWWRVGAFLTVMFFVLLSDAILSDFVPGYMQGKLGSPLAMGLVMAFSSIVGLMLDLIFPQLLRGAGIRKLAGMAMVGSLAFVLSMLGSTWAGGLWLLLGGMAAWGVYYELDSFLTKQFVAESAPAHARGAVWGVVGVFRNLAYFLGPLLGGVLAVQGEKPVLWVAGAVLLTGYLLFWLIKLPERSDETIEPHGVNVGEEVRHWIRLGKVAWPVLTMSLIAGIIDAVFWTTGTVVNDLLGEIHPAGKWFLSVYMLPSLVVGFVIAKWGIYRGKKKWAEIFLGLGGLTLAGLGLVDGVGAILVCVLIASIFFSLSWPLVDAVYSDFAVRMKKGRKHMIGISSSILSLAYIIGPILAGWLASTQGEIKSFGWVGIVTFAMAIWLLCVTPRKVRLPEAEIQKWD